MQKFTIFALVATSVSGSLFKRQYYENETYSDFDAYQKRLLYLMQVCNPRDSSKPLDFTTPCNAMMAIEATCTYGTDFYRDDSLYNDSNDEELQPLDFKTQQACMCESQMFDQLNGCNACRCYTAIIFHRQHASKSQLGSTMHC